MKLLALLALFAAGAVHAATTYYVSSCTNGGSTFKTVGISTQTTVEVAQAPGVSATLCQLLSATPGTWSVRTSTNGGVSWAWTVLSTLNLGVTPPPIKVQMTVTWTPVTAFTSGALITVPLTYNVYRGLTATALAQVGSTGALLFNDTAVVPSTTYYYAITATCSGCTESAKSAVVSGVPIPVVAQPLVPIAPSGVIAK
jgi:hypothetical protein